MMDEECPDLVPIEAPHESKKIPVTILTGYLGSGKTTLLRNILTGSHGKRIAVILNDYTSPTDIGSLPSIEKSMGYANNLTSATKKDDIQDSSESKPLFTEWIDLQNGCMCCSVKDSAVGALESLLQREGSFDYVVLETAGTADPSPIASMFWLDDELEAKIKLDGIVTVVDAMYTRKYLNEAGEFKKQLAVADRIVLNKIDLVKDEEVFWVETKIREINQLAPLLKTSKAQVSLDFILGINAYEIFDEETVRNFKESHHHPDTSIVTVNFLCEESIDRKRLDKWLQSVLWEKQLPNDNLESLDILRIKGVLNLQNSTTRTILQAIGELFDFHETTSWEPDSDRRSRIVIIGRHFDEATIQSSLHRFLFDQ